MSKLCITAGVLNNFISHGFATAMLLHVSLSHMVIEYGITIQDQYSTRSDAGIVTLVQQNNVATD